MDGFVQLRQMKINELNQFVLGSLEEISNHRYYKPIAITLAVASALTVSYLALSYFAQGASFAISKALNIYFIAPIVYIATSSPVVTVATAIAKAANFVFDAVFKDITRQIVAVLFTYPILLHLGFPPQGMRQAKAPGQ